MNSWSITGTVNATGIRGVKYPTFWVQVEIDPIMGVYTDKTQIFVNFPSEADPNSKKRKRTDFLQSRLTAGTFFFTYDVLMTNISRSRKVNDQWENYDEMGYKGKLYNIASAPRRFSPVNAGCVSGRVLQHSDNKLIVAERYRLPSNNEWKEREIPVLTKNIVSDLTNKEVVVYGQICGRTPNGEPKAFVYSDSIIPMTNE